MVAVTLHPFSSSPLIPVCTWGVPKHSEFTLRWAAALGSLRAAECRTGTRGYLSTGHGLLGVPSSLGRCSGQGPQAGMGAVLTLCWELYPRLLPNDLDTFYTGLWQPSRQSPSQTWHLKADYMKLNFYKCLKIFILMMIVSCD